MSSCPVTFWKERFNQSETNVSVRHWMQHSSAPVGVSGVPGWGAASMATWNRLDPASEKAKWPRTNGRWIKMTKKRWNPVCHREEEVAERERDAGVVDGNKYCICTLTGLRVCFCPCIFTCLNALVWVDKSDLDESWIEGVQGCWLARLWPHH